jgi:hypothetical protein
VASCGLTLAQARSTSWKSLVEASKSFERVFNDLSSGLYPGFEPDVVLTLLFGTGLSPRQHQKHDYMFVLVRWGRREGIDRDKSYIEV